MHASNRNAMQRAIHPVKAKALRMASRKLGGNGRLRDFLRVPAERLVRWLSGAEDPPTPVLLKAVEVILDDLDKRDGGGGGPGG
jgi:hypothetical protein